MLTFKVHKKFINEFVFINHFERVHKSMNIFHNMATLYIPVIDHTKSQASVFYFMCIYIVYVYNPPLMFNAKL